MVYDVVMGLPEMKALWENLQQRHIDGTISKEDESLYKKWGKTMKLIAQNPFHPSLQTHEIKPLSKRYGTRVWQPYLENRTSDAMRTYWVYGPKQQQITIVGLEPHPEDKKNGAYDRIKLSDLPPLL